jgi:type VI secretion system secreted protein VgrG
MGWCSKPDKSSKTAEKKGGDKKVDDPKQPCPQDDANIVSIAWLDGADDKEVATATQWVNLPKDDKWVNGDEIKNKDRLGLKPRIKVKFDKPGSHAFKVKLLPPSGTDRYTDTEKGRNTHFKYTETEKSFTTDADGTKIIDGSFSLVAGGGYKFKAQAKDSKDKIVKTGDLTTKRLFYYVECKMTGLTSALSSTAPIETEYAKHHIVMKKHTALSIARQNNIDPLKASETSTLKTNVTNAVDANATVKKTKPYLIAVAYTDHLAVKHANVVIEKDAVPVGPGKPKVQIPVVARGVLPPHANKTCHLWHSLVPGEGWFVEAKFHKTGGGVTDIPEAKVTGKGSGDKLNKVEVDVASLPAGTGKIKVKVHVVDLFAGGVSLGGSNKVCVCTRAWWGNSSNADQQQTIIHEVGHTTGMVANATGNLPDKVATHYADKGHKGDHCYKGCAAGAANYNTSANLAASQCSMFGSLNGKNAFCDNCAKAVKKLDLGSGW